jgi:hypothetical protein
MPINFCFSAFEDRQKQKRLEIDSKPLFGSPQPKVTTGNDARKILLSRIRKTNHFSSQETLKSLAVKDLGIVRKTKSNSEETVSVNPENITEIENDNCDTCGEDTNAKERLQQNAVSHDTTSNVEVDPDSEETCGITSQESNALSSLMQDYIDSDSGNSDRG